MSDRFVNLMFHIDTNRINSRCNLRWMNILEQWDKTNIIDLSISKVAQQEAVIGNSRLREKRAYSLIA
jgi:hypothetical protein